jgi:chemosensory pili system protein ChpA (sensor histidine kinase/response regulator)
MQELVSESLHIVGEELAVTLNDMRVALEHYADGGGGPRAVEKCIQLLHAANGALRVAETYGASLLAEEMEGTCRHLGKLRPDDRRAEEALEALSRAAVQLPSYVDLIINGGRDIPLVLLPLLNDLRAARGRPLLSESTLLLLNIGSPEMPAIVLESRAGSDENVEDLCTQLRPGFQLALLGWIRGDDPTGHLTRIGDVAERLEQASTSREVHQLWWVVGGVVEALLEGGLDTSVSLKRLLGQADREMKRLPTIGEEAYQQNPPTELVNNLLYYIARSKASGLRVGAIRAAFNLSDLVPGDDQVEAARDSLAAPSPRLMTTVAQAIREDLGRVKDVLDIYVRTGMQHVEELTPQIELLKKIGDTLGVLGLGDLRETIQQKRAELQQIIDAGDAVEEAALLEMAGALLYVEDHLEERLFGLIRPPEAGASAEPVDADFEQVAQAVMRECVVNLARIKDAVAQVLDRSNESALLDSVPGYLRGITAGLIILEKEAAVGVVEEIGDVIGDLITRGYDGVGREQLDLLADAIVSVEYYMETLQAGRKEPGYMLENASECLRALNDSKPAVPELNKPDTSGMSTTVQIPDYAETQVASAVTQVIPILPVTDAGGEERVDPELIELFIEEAGEEIDSIRVAFPTWAQDDTQTDLLNQIRRSFHTLKGSGRMVGAESIAEFSWKFEDLLNRLINGTLERTPEIVECVRKATDALPEVLEQLEVGSEPETDIAALLSEAEQLAQGESTAEQTDDIAADAIGAADGEVDVEFDIELDIGSDDDLDGEFAANIPAVEIDPALMEILSMETGSHIEVVLNFVSAAAESIPPFLVDEELHRACHTLHGSVTMAQATPAGEVTGPLNNMIRRAYEHDTPIDEEAVAACADAVEAIAGIIRCLERRADELPDTRELQARLVTIDERIEAEIEAAEAVDDASIPPGVLSEDSSALAFEDTAFHPVEFDTSSEDALAEDVDGPQEGLRSEGQAEEQAEEQSGRQPETQPDFDPEIAEIFSEEAAELLEAIDTEIARATDDEFAPGALAELQRHMHTLKGGARLSGLMAMGDLSHDVETLLVRLAGGALTQSAISFGVLRATIDELHRLRDLVMDGRAEAPASQLVERLQALLEDRAVEEDVASLDSAAKIATEADEFEEPESLDDAQESEPIEWTAADFTEEEVAPEAVTETGEPGAEIADEALAEEAQATADESDTDEAAAAESVEDEAAHEETVATVETPDDAVRTPSIPISDNLGALVRELEQPPVPESRDLAEFVQPAIPEAPSRARREPARVDPALLENLLNNAGEVSIFHSRLTQQMGQVRFNLQELGETVARLREQLRSLEGATEAQIIYQHQSERHEDAEVDPLTLERYSKIQQLSRSLAETSNDVSSIKDLLQNLVGDTEALLVQQARTAAELQDGLMRTRMVGFHHQGARLARLARQTGSEHGKRVELTLHGGGEIDRQVLEKIMPPLEHMVRNAVIHGVETPEERATAGKPETGVVTINLRREGAQIVIELADDGRGMHAESIRRKAIDLGLADAEAELTQDEILQFVVRPGFSTADKLTHAAGRGVGMDVAASEIARLGGTLHIDTEPGAGTTFSIRLPFTLAVTQALIVRVGQELFAMPLPTVEGIIRIPREEFAAKLAESDPRIEYGGREYNFRHLGQYLGLGPTHLPEDQDRVSVMLVQAGSHSTALVADEMLDSREIVVKPLGGQLSAIRGISGATILGDGRIVVILDVASLVRLTPKPVSPEDLRPETGPTEPLALVVDDSITMRRVTQRLLERHGMRVVTARDGVEAVSMLREHMPDIILLDVEMPRMDGYEFAAHVRSNSMTAKVPIIMITSRVSDKHKARAIELGVNDYLGKPYQEANLLAAVNELLDRD